MFDLAASAQTYPFRHSDADWTDLGAPARPQYVDLAGRLSGRVEGFLMARPADTLSLLGDVANGASGRIDCQHREVGGTPGPLEKLHRPGVLPRHRRAVRHITRVWPVTASFQARSGDMLGMSVRAAVEPA